MKVTVILIVIGALGAVIKGFSKRTRELGDKNTSVDDPNYSIAEIGQNTERAHGDSRRLVVTQTPVKDHQLMLMWKILKE